MKKVVIAFDSFKGSLTSKEASEAAACGVKSSETDWHCELKPIADGGEGTMETVVDALGGEMIELRVSGPLNDRVSARYGICGETAVIEVAQACGLTLIPKHKRDPENTTTFGVGEMITDAMDKGCRKFKIGLGGTATNDAGIGMLRALGYRFYDSKGEETGLRAKDIGQIRMIDLSNVDGRLHECEFVIACDVKNPLYGPDGASFVFGAQKGADRNMQLRLEEALKSFAEIVRKISVEDYSTVPGAGAAGGLGFAFISLLNASLVSGIEMVLDTIGFKSSLDDCDLVITGEGKIDFQTAMGKAPSGVLKMARHSGIPVIAVGGSVDSAAIPDLLKAGFKAIFPIVPSPVTMEEAMKKDVAENNLKQTIGQIFRVLG